MSATDAPAQQYEAPLAPQRGRWEEFWSLFKRNRLAIFGLAIFIAFFVVAILGLVLTSGSEPYLNPSMVRLQEKLRPPGALPNLESLSDAEVPRMGRYIFGTDDLGRDVFARMLQGAWVSLTVGFVAVGIALVIGIFMGGIAGYFGQYHIRTDQILVILLLVLGVVFNIVGPRFYGVVLVIAALGIWRMAHIKPAHEAAGPQAVWQRYLRSNAVSVDALIMRLVDIMLCFPSFFLILTVVALLPASIYNIMIIIGLTSWMGATRFVRAEFLSLREQEFVLAARALGVSNLRIIFRHMMPNAIAPVLVSATIGIASAILTEAGLSFLGFGVPPPHATWGNILSDGKRFIFDAPWLTFIPGLTILIVVLSFNLFGEGLRDVLNPKLRERH